MSTKRGNKAADPAHTRTGERRTTGKKKKTDSHGPGRNPGENRIDESGEESFPASDPPAHGIDPERDIQETHARDTKPVEGEREPDDDDGGIGGEVRRSGHERENPDPLEGGED